MTKSHNSSSYFLEVIIHAHIVQRLLAGFDIFRLQRCHQPSLAGNDTLIYK